MSRLHLGQQSVLQCSHRKKTSRIEESFRPPSEHRADVLSTHWQALPFPFDPPGHQRKTLWSIAKRVFGMLRDALAKSVLAAVFQMRALVAGPAYDRRLGFIHFNSNRYFQVSSHRFDPHKNVVTNHKNVTMSYANHASI